MKKLLTILLACTLVITGIVLPASADGIYYPCYERQWKTNANGCSLEIYQTEGNKMSFHFQYGEFFVSFYNADIDGYNVYGKYCKDYGNPADGAYILEGNIALNLGDSCIWLIWNGTENGRWFENSFQFTKKDFKYIPIYDTYSNIILNGQTLALPQNPIIMNDRILVPIRAIGEALGAEVIYNENTKKVGTNVNVIKNDKSITFFLTDTKYSSEANPSYMWIDTAGMSSSRKVHLDAPITLYNGTTMVPVRAISEAFGANVAWDPNTQNVNISTATSGQEPQNNADSAEASAQKAAGLAEAKIKSEWQNSEHNYEEYEYKYFVIDYKTKYLVCARITKLADGEQRYWVNKSDHSLTYIGNGSDWYIDKNAGIVYWFEGSTAAPDGSQRADNIIYEF